MQAGKGEKLFFGGGGKVFGDAGGMSWYARIIFEF